VLSLSKRGIATLMRPSTGSGRGAPDWARRAL